MASNRLPPLNALRVFEVAAELQSFTKAAEALHVTNAAVSHQVRQLEDFLGLALFERRNNRLRLTPAGEHYLPRIRDAFLAIRQATDLLRQDQAQALRIAVPAVLAAKWLVPRLYRFFTRHPEQRLEIVADGSLQDCELALSDRQLSDPHFGCERIASTCVSPVCQPALANALSAPRELLTHTLLTERADGRGSHRPNWDRWLDEAGLEPDAATVLRECTDTAAALQAAIDGEGVALAQDLLVEYDLAAGRLSHPLRTESSLRVSYYLLYPQAQAESVALANLRSWLRDEAGA
ncbi:LysR substrate-binding domain-containing protein [Niveibacterium sp. SC-1]|uniref:LysR substrate-binding domain-containing protein n=1 Tax=Niveibacterium sp. SC-1 TaxID=3135646 RepID=UPI00311F5753